MGMKLLKWEGIGTKKICSRTPLLRNNDTHNSRIFFEASYSISATAVRPLGVWEHFKFPTSTPSSRHLSYRSAVERKNALLFLFTHEPCTDTARSHDSTANSHAQLTLKVNFSTTLAL